MIVSEQIIGVLLFGAEPLDAACGLVLRDDDVCCVFLISGSKVGNNGSAAAAHFRYC